MTVRDLLSRGDGAAVALRAPGRVALSYDALRDHVADMVAHLNRSGIARRDRVAIALHDGPEMATAFLAVASVAVAAPLNPRFTAAEFDLYLNDLNPSAIVIEAGSRSAAVAAAQRRAIPLLELTPRLDEAAGLFSLSGDVGPARADASATRDDCALVLHTSGTTARPKRVPLTHRQLCASARNVAQSLELTPADRGLHVMPLFHIHGLVAGLLAPLYSGGSVYCTPGFQIQPFAGWLSDAKPTWLTAVPTMHQSVRDWARHEPDAARTAGLRFIRSCSAALAPTIAHELEAAFGVPVLQAYAMTEAAHQIACNPLPPAERKFGSVGRAAGPEVAILDAEGNVLAPDETGEVAIRGENVITGYEDNPQANAAAFGSGWFRTGDLGALDRDGYLWLSGRVKEMINRGGEKISPIEIENVLLTHPAVSQAVVFAAPHASLGEEVAAAIVLRAGEQASEEALRSLVLAQLSLAKAPRRIVFAQALPKGPTGKLRRIGLAEILGVGPRDRPAYVAPRSAVERGLAETWRRALAVAAVGVDDDFFDLGGNSIAALQIATEVQQSFGVEIELSRFLRAPTVAGLALSITEQRMLALDSKTAARLLAEVEGAEDACR